MKKITAQNKKKAPSVRINKSLDKYDCLELFPEKVKKAKETLQKFGLPDVIQKSR